MECSGIIRRTRNLSIIGRAQQTHPAALHDAYKWRRTSRPPSMHLLSTCSTMGASQITRSRRLLTAAFPPSKAVKRNLCDFGSTTAPPNDGGRPPSMISVMRDALLEYLLRKPNLYLNEMVVYLWGRVRTSCHKNPVSAGLCDLQDGRRRTRVE
jgi:hypothetical protein